MGVSERPNLRQATGLGYLAAFSVVCAKHRGCALFQRQHGRKGFPEAFSRRLRRDLPASARDDFQTRRLWSGGKVLAVESLTNISSQSQNIILAVKIINN